MFEKSNSCGTNKGSAERKDLHPSAIRYSSRHKTPEGCGIFACKEGFPNCIKINRVFSKVLELCHEDTRAGNTATRFQRITGLGYLKIDHRILFLATVI